MPFDALPAVSAGLASAAYARLVATFARDGHTPSPEQWAAIRDLLEHLERAANGKLEPALYLSAIPAGTGKSRSLQAFAATLMDDPNYAETGMLIIAGSLLGRSIPRWPGASMPRKNLRSGGSWR